MKKKNIILSMLTIMMVAALGIFVASCNKNSSSSGDTVVTTSPVVGTWTGSMDGADVTLKMNEDKTGYILFEYEDEYSGTEYEKYNLTYKMDTQTSGLAIVEIQSSYYGTEYEKYPFEIDEKIMYVYEDEDDNDILCVLHKQ